MQILMSDVRHIKWEDLLCGGADQEFMFRRRNASVKFLAGMCEIVTW